MPWLEAGTEGAATHQAAPATTNGFASRGFSYAVVLGSVLVGLVAPQAAALLLGPPVLAGLLFLGLAHGACDQFVMPTVRSLPASLRSPVRYWLGFLVAYLGLALLMALSWWYWPGGTVGVFFGLTVWHWGTADAPQPTSYRQVWLWHGVLRGLLLFALPAIAWPTETLHIIQSLLAFAGALPLSPLVFVQVVPWLGALVVFGHVGLWTAYAIGRYNFQWRHDAFEVGVLTALFVVLPPVLALGVYFSFWHSWQHIVRLNLTWTPARQVRAIGQELRLFGRKAWPLLLVSVVALGVLAIGIAPRLQTPDDWLSLALVVASIVTLPHAVLVSTVLDARTWGRPRTSLESSAAA